MASGRRCGEPHPLCPGGPRSLEGRAWAPTVADCQTLCTGGPHPLGPTAHCRRAARARRSRGQTGACGRQARVEWVSSTVPPNALNCTLSPNAPHHPTVTTWMSATWKTSPPSPPAAWNPQMRTTLLAHQPPPHNPFTSDRAGLGKIGLDREAPAGGLDREGQDRIMRERAGRRKGVGLGPDLGACRPYSPSVMRPLTALSSSTCRACVCVCV